MWGTNSAVIKKIDLSQQAKADILQSNYCSLQESAMPLMF